MRPERFVPLLAAVLAGALAAFAATPDRFAVRRGM
jgi:hypothetical protein